MGLFKHHHDRHNDTNTDMAHTDMADGGRFNTQDPSVRTTNNPIHPDHAGVVGNKPHPNAVNNGPTGVQNHYDEAYDGAPATNAGVDNSMVNQNHNGLTGHNGNHTGNHNGNHKGMVGAGLGAAAGMAAGKHMHNHNHNGNGLHHNRGGTIPNEPGMNHGMTGAGMVGTGAGIGAGSAMDPTTMIAEEHNNFPGTNPHSDHSALSGRGDGLTFPGRV